MIQAIQVVTLLAVGIHFAEGHCGWAGAAPFCDPSSCEYERTWPAAKVRSGGWSNFGNTCLTGTKKYCCSLDFCAFTGSAPICDPSGCGDQDVIMGATASGNRGECWTGRTKMCCRMDDAWWGHVKVTLHEDFFWTGRFNEHYDRKASCIDVKYPDHISSMNTHNGCVRIYSKRHCLGRTRAIWPGPIDHGDLGKISFNDDVKSIGPCFDYDTQPMSKLFRRSGGRQRKGSGSGWTELAHVIGGAVYELGRMSGLTTHENRPGPVEFVQTSPRNGRVEAMQATIRREHLHTGTATDQGARDHVRRLGQHDDDAGHILANSLGGSGTDPLNLFPQSPSINRGVFSRWEAQVRDLVNFHGQVTYYVVLVYESDDSTRPFLVMTNLQYSHDGEERALIGGFHNPE